MSVPQPKFVSMDELAPTLLDILALGGSVELMTTGSSMRPMLFDKESVVRLTAPNVIRRGDVALYRYPNGKFALHRIAKVMPDTLTCRGDNLIFEEPDIRRDWILAVVSDFTYHGKWVSCRNRCYRFYTACCLFFWPWRRTYFTLRHKLARILRK